MSKRRKAHKAKPPYTDKMPPMGQSNVRGTAESPFPPKKRLLQDLLKAED